MSVSAEVPERQQSRIAELNARYVDYDSDAVLRDIIEVEFAKRVCVVSSFGAESVVLLHQVSQIDPSIPVMFLNTGKLFGETLRFRDRLQSFLGLMDVRSLGPRLADLELLDSAGDLWSRDGDRCCHIRKVLPQRRALEGFGAVITGRKRFQTSLRSGLDFVELEDVQTGRVSINPLVHYDMSYLSGYIEAHNLPRHPLVRDGYLSIGCMPCTSRVEAGGDYRSGRWSGSEKEECGIHAADFVDGDGI